MGAVGTPLDVVPAVAATATDVITESGAVLIRRHLEANDFGGVDVDNDALDHGHVFVAYEGILPRFELRMTVRDGDEVHLAIFALVLLEGGDLLRVRRPDEDGAIALLPTGVVGGVAVVLDAVGGELRLFAGGDVAHPEVVVADERGLGLVGREIGCGAATSSRTCWRSVCFVRRGDGSADACATEVTAELTTP